MANQKAPSASSPSPASAPAPITHEEQSQNTGWTVLFKPLFWFLVLPGGVLFLLKWLTGF
jgi:hypothetical protein